MSNSNSPLKDYEKLENKILSIGKSIFDLSASSDQKSYFSKDYWYGQIMQWSMKNQKFKTQMFRFVDVLPYLNSGKEVSRHLKEYFSEGGDKLPAIFNVGVGVGSLAPGIMAATIKKNVTQMAKLFIVGETPKDALTVLKKARKQNISFTVDILGEATLSESEAKDYQSRYIELIAWLAKDANSWGKNELLDSNHLGEIPKINISVKLSALYSQIKQTSWEESIEVLKTRLRPIYREAMNHGVFLNLDMEYYDIKNLTIEVFKQLISEEEFKDYPHWGIVIQAYLRDSLEDLKSLQLFAKGRNQAITVRLVKGAYWDSETIHAAQRDWPVPVYTNKQESDANYEDCARFALENYHNIHLTIGSHNVRSIAATIAMAEDLNVPQNAFEIQMLYGMADTFKKALVKMNYRVREYAPVGELIPGMAYLVRRLLENTSNESFLKSKFSDNLEIQSLLKDPKKDLVKTTPLDYRLAFDNDKDNLYNAALLDFNNSSYRSKLQAALDKIATDSSNGIFKTKEIYLDGKYIKTDRTLKSYNPSQKEECLGEIYIAGTKEAELAIQSAKKHSSLWQNTTVETRATILEKLADIVLQNRFDLMALEIKEAGKTWIEADGDITETIDFCRYYAKEIRRISKPIAMSTIPGETNFLSYKARGVALVIAPWNFPLAILAGLTTAALVTGNTVLMKPAEQTSLIAAKLMEMLIQAGLPTGVLQFLPGYGEEIGEYLVNHKDVDTIAFTGSKNVGLGILQKSSVIQTGQKNIKKCIIEMGGKNALIIDSDADLDEAVKGVIYSAFAFQGQKCSACSRVIVLEDNYDKFINRLKEATSSIKVLPTENPDAYLGPVIDEEVYNKINSIVESAKQSSTLLFQKDVPTTGYFVSPTIFTDVDPKSNLAQSEIFGPVLAVIKVKTIEEALGIANDTEYALTGGAFSRSPANIDYIKENLEAGNVYINRSITGAMVKRHPFGGFKMSGIGNKAGGPNYLSQFMDEKNISENTLRCGFAPELFS